MTTDVPEVSSNEPNARPSGRIRDEDIVAVREAARIEEVVEDHVTLKRAGGNLMGLCPFHDEKGPSFSVTPAKNFFYCFGCGEGGDAISFVQKIEHLTFVEAVEKLAERYKVPLTYTDGPRTNSLPSGQRSRLVAANAAAAAFYREQLKSEGAAPGRALLEGRGFDEAAADQFEVGYSPAGWDALTTHLRSKGFSDEEIVTAGLAVSREGKQGVYDRFRGRLMWPIRDLSGDVIGFGARKLLDDDQGPKYLNTPDTPLYRKSEVLYGIHAARKNIAQKRTCVVVEGYTDVMACHLSGIDTAVAACGTAFGEGHVRIVRRLIHDNDMFSGKVVFTFDGDAAGQKAALRAFKENQKFTASTYVAIAPKGYDPCELRMHVGEEAVRDLVNNAAPLVEFVLRTTIDAFDLDTVEGRTHALRSASPIVASMRDQTMRLQYTMSLAGWLGLDVNMVRSAVAKTAVPNGASGQPAVVTESTPEVVAAGGWERPDPKDPNLAAEREALKIWLQAPQLATGWAEQVTPSAFTHASYRRVVEEREVAAERSADPSSDLRNHADPGVRSLASELSVEPLPVKDATDVYARGVLARLLDKAAERQIAAVKSRMSRLAPGDPEQETLLTQLLALQKTRQDLRALGRR